MVGSNEPESVYFDSPFFCCRLTIPLPLSLPLPLSATILSIKPILKSPLPFRSLRPSARARRRLRHFRSLFLWDYIHSGLGRTEPRAHERGFVLFGFGPLLFSKPNCSNITLDLQPFYLNSWLRHPCFLSWSKTRTADGPMFR